MRPRTPVTSHAFAASPKLDTIWIERLHTLKRNTIVLGAVLFLLATFAWAGWANFEYRKQAADKMLASTAQGELVGDDSNGVPHRVRSLQLFHLARGATVLTGPVRSSGTYEEYR